MEGDAAQSWRRMRDCADHNKKSWKCGKLTKKSGLGRHRALANQKSRGASWMNWILRCWAHLLHRATLDICGAVLDYDQAHSFNLSAIICCIILTFAFGMTGQLHQAKMHCQFPLNFCWIWWSRFNSLDEYWWKVGFVIYLMSSIDIFLCWFLMDAVPLCEAQHWIISCLSRCNALYWTKQYAGNWKF